MTKLLTKREIADWYGPDRERWQHRQPSNMIQFRRRDMRKSVHAAIERVTADNARVKTARLGERATQVRAMIRDSRPLIHDAALVEEYRAIIKEMRMIRRLEGFRALPGSALAPPFPFDPVSRHIPSAYWDAARKYGIQFETVECDFPDRAALSAIVEETASFASAWWTYLEHRFSDRVSFLFADSASQMMFKMFYANYLYVPNASVE